MKKFYKHLLFCMLSILPAMVSASSLQPFIDILAWKASESNSAWAETDIIATNSKTVLNSTNTYNTRPGIKAGFLYIPEDYFWDTKLYWTYFSTNSSHTIPTDSNQINIVSSLFFSGSPFISHDIFFGGNSQWDLTMNMIDLDISHSFTPTPTFTVSPAIGLKGGSINQSIHANWDAIVYTSTENVTSDFTGIGPSIGLDAKWNFVQHFDLVGSFSTALLYGRWNMKDAYHRPVAGIISEQNITTTLNQAQLGSFMTDYFFGLQWTYQGTSKITAQLGYEMQYWSNQLRLLSIQQLPAEGDLTLQGGTCGISIDL